MPGPRVAGTGMVAAGRLVGLGIDVVDIPRLAGMLGRRPSMRTRLFTSQERQYAESMATPAITYAGRFAAKEALMKSLGVGLGAVGWWDVEVLRCDGGRPRLVISGRAAALAVSLGVAGWQLSISHTDTVASAVVAALS
ncbi:MAG: holo-ACP synthase [Actinomycetota bacterium]|nr:holo-ACP synthase [Actinomycetota bacterium]